MTKTALTHNQCVVRLDSFAPADAMKILLAFSKHLLKTHESYLDRVNINHIPEGLVISPDNSVLFFIDTKDFLWDVYFAQQEHKDIIDEQLDKILMGLD